MSDSELLQEWLSECRTQSTRKNYRRSINTFKEWYGKPVGEFLALEPKEARHVAITFQAEALDGWQPKTRANSRAHTGNLRPNTILSVLTALGSLCQHEDKPLYLKGKRVRRTIDLDSHAFTTHDLARMFNVGNTEEKAILATFCSLGWEVSALLALERGHVQNLILRAQEQRQRFIYFISQRQKTGATRLGVLNPLAIEWISEWLKVPVENIQRTKANCAWNPKRLFSYTTQDGVNRMIKHLARDAHVTVTGRVHTHQLRKWVMSGLSRAGFNEFQIKFLLGKAIPLSDMTYLQTLQQEIEARYPKAFEEYLNISGKHQIPINEEQLSKLKDLLELYDQGKIVRVDR